MEVNSIQETVDLSKLKCLYIDDQLDSQILFKIQLKELRSVKFAQCFEDAVPLLNSEKFDYILIDIYLPGINGIDAMKIIKNKSLNALVPIIAVSAYVLPGDKEKYFQAGFDDFVAKPLFRKNVISAMNRLSQKKEPVVQERIHSYPQLFATVLDQIKELRRRMEITIHPVKISLPELPEVNEVVGPKKAPQSLSDLSCLYLDFYQDNYILLNAQLHDLKNLKFAQTFEEALPHLDEGKFDLIVMDLGFRDEFSELEVIDVIRQRPEYSNFPIIAVSAHKLTDQEREIVKNKFTTFIPKPLLRKNVVPVLNQIFFEKKE